MERTVLRYAPSYWDTSYEYDRQFELNQSSEEFNRIRHQVRQAMGNNNLSVNQILRVQNIHDYGQFLIKQQLMAVDKSYKNYYRVRRFTTLKKHYLTCALDYNLDHRRCGKSSLLFKKKVDYVAHDEIILVVQVVTDTPNDDCIEPANSSEYFIDYIVRV